MSEQASTAGEAVVSAPDSAPAQSRRLVAPLQRYASLIIVIALGVTLVGFLRGTSEPPPLDKSRVEVVAATNPAPAAVAYSQLPTATIRANAEWKSKLSDLISEAPKPFHPVEISGAVRLALQSGRRA